MPDPAAAVPGSSKLSRQGAYLAALLANGGDPVAACTDVGITHQARSLWRVDELYTAAEDAVRALAGNTTARRRPHTAGGPVTAVQKAAFLTALESGATPHEAAVRAGVALSRLRTARRSDEAFTDAWQALHASTTSPNTQNIPDAQKLQQQKQALAAFREGATRKGAARAVGVSPATLAHWEETDPQYGAAAARARIAYAEADQTWGSHDLARACDVPVGSIYNWRARPDFPDPVNTPAGRYDPRSLRFDPQEVIDWCAARGWYCDPAAARVSRPATGR